MRKREIAEGQLLFLKDLDMATKKPKTNWHSSTPYQQGYKHMPQGKYTQLFASLQAGQSIVCPSVATGKVVYKAFSTHLSKRQLPGKAAIVKQHPATGKAHVYWIPADKPAKAK